MARDSITKSLEMVASDVEPVESRYASPNVAKLFARPRSSLLFFIDYVLLPLV